MAKDGCPKCVARSGQWSPSAPEESLNKPDMVGSRFQDRSSYLQQKIRERLNRQYFRLHVVLDVVR